MLEKSSLFMSVTTDISELTSDSVSYKNEATDLTTVNVVSSESYPGQTSTEAMKTTSNHYTASYSLNQTSIDTTPSGVVPVHVTGNAKLNPTTVSEPETPSNNSSIVGVAVTAAGKKVPLLVLILAPLLAVIFFIFLCCFLAFRYCRKEAEEPVNETPMVFDNMAYDTATGVTIIAEEDDIKKKKELEPPDVVYVEPVSDKKKLEEMMVGYEQVDKPPPYQENDPMGGAWALPVVPRYVETNHNPRKRRDETPLEEDEHLYEEIPERSHYANMDGGVHNHYVLPDPVDYVNVRQPINPWTGQAQAVTPVTEAEEQNQINDLVQEL